MPILTRAPVTILLTDLFFGSDILRAKFTSQQEGKLRWLKRRESILREEWSSLSGKSTVDLRTKHSQDITESVVNHLPIEFSKDISVIQVIIRGNMRAIYDNEEELLQSCYGSVLGQASPFHVLRHSNEIASCVAQPSNRRTYKWTVSHHPTIILSNMKRCIESEFSSLARNVSETEQINTLSHLLSHQKSDAWPEWLAALPNKSLVPVEYRSDRKLMLSLIERSGEYFSIASEELRNERDFVFEAIKRNQSIELDSKWYSDTGIMIQAIRYDPDLVRHLDVGRDRALLHRCLSANPRVYDNLPPSMQEEKEIILKVVGRIPFYSERVLSLIGNDQELLLRLVPKTNEAILKGPDTVEFIKLALPLLELNYFGAFDNRVAFSQTFASVLAQPREVLLPLVACHGPLYHVLSDEMQQERDVSLSALKNTIKMSDHIPKQWLLCREFILEAADELNVCELIRFSTHVKDPVFMRRVIETNGSTLSMTSCDLTEFWKEFEELACISSGFVSKFSEGLYRLRVESEYHGAKLYNDE